LSIIDTKKPLQLVDGTPATYEGPSSLTGVSGRATFVVRVRGTRRHYTASGKHIHANYKDIQNVPEVAPQIDWSKPVRHVDGTLVKVDGPVTGEVMGVRREDGLHFTRSQYDGHGEYRVVYVFRDGRSDHGRAPLFKNRADAPAAPAPVPATPTLDLKGTLTTADGKKVRLLVNDTANIKPLVVEVLYSAGNAAIERRFADGRTVSQPGRTSGDDLINPVVIKSAFHNLYENGRTGETAHPTYEAAQRFSKKGRARVGIIETVTRNGKWFSAKLHLGVPYTA
jgi:hypothetical protein